MTRLALDSSFTLAWCFDDESSPRTDAVLNQAGQLVFVVPPLWRWETANALLMGERRGRIQPDRTSEILVRLSRLNIEVDEGWSSVTYEEVLKLARQHKLTVYDAAYLEMAIRLNLQLATLDGPLEAAAKKMGITVI